MGKKTKAKFVKLISFTLINVFALYLTPGFIWRSLTPVHTFTVHNGNLQTTVSCTGNVEAGEERDLYYSMPLKTDKIEVKIGDSVKSGQSLVDVDREDTIETFNNLNKTTSSSGTSDTAGGDTADSTSSYLDALSGNTDLSSYSSLIGNYAGASSGLGSYGGTSSDTSAAADQGSTSGDSSITSDTEIPTTITAPISGVVTSLNVEQGGFSDPSKPVAVITNMDSLQIRAQVDEVLISSIKVGQPVTVTGNGFNSVYHGTVTEIYPTAHEETTDSGTSTVVDTMISIHSPGKDLKPGLTANVKITTSDNPKAIIAPYTAIQQDDSNHEFVYVYRLGRAVKTYITTGKESDQSLEIVSGLQAGDQIIVNPPDTLKNGQHVRQLKAAEGD